MNRSLIVIGPDRVGKTTVCNRLSSLSGLPVFKFPSEKEIFKNGGSDSLIFDWGLTQFLKQSEYNFISDRGYPCEYVYSQVFGRKTNLDLLKKIDEEHAKLGTEIIFLHSTDVPEEEDDIIDKKYYYEIVDMYYNFVHTFTKCNVMIPPQCDVDKMLLSFKNGVDISTWFAGLILFNMAS